MVTCWHAVALLTLKAIISALLKEVVQPVKAELELDCAEVMVGNAEPVIVLAIVGGKLPNGDFQMSMTMEPTLSASIFQLLIVRAIGTSIKPLSPGTIAVDGPSLMTNSKDTPCPIVVNPAEMSVKMVFQVAERITCPAAAFSAPVGGVYVPSEYGIMDALQR